MVYPYFYLFKKKKKAILHNYNLLQKCIILSHNFEHTYNLLHNLAIFCVIPEWQGCVGQARLLLGRAVNCSERG